MVDKTLLVSRAAHNNALWCDLVCSTHGSKGEFCDAYWQSQGPAPRFYPNLVTLQKDAAAVVVQLKKIQQETASQPRSSWSVKDSFNLLDLQPLGFQRLFEAEWIYRPAGKITSGFSDHDLVWSKISDIDYLADWEQTWSGDDSLFAQKRIFSTSLLNRSDVAVLGAYRNQRLVGGVIANHGARVVGLSNLFGPPLEQQTFWLEAANVAQIHFPDLPLVGYERGQDLMFAKEAGFESLQSLAVWVSQMT